jgi:DNA repair protein RadC
MRDIDMPKATTKNAKARRAPAAFPNCIQHLEPRDRRLVERALRVLEDSAVYRTEAFTSPGAVRNHLQLRFAGLEHEEFHALWLDGQNRLISTDRLFTGTLTQTAVYPREVVKAALAHNAGAVILAHNHPSGLSEPSAADKLLTRALKAALAVVDVKVLDHIIVAGTRTLSFAEHGLL